MEVIVKQSGLQPYDKTTNQGFWRILLHRESKKTKQVLISVAVTDGIATDDQLKWIEDQLMANFKAGSLIGSGFTIVSLSMIFTLDISGAYKEQDRLKLLSGDLYYEENLFGFRFRVSPFAFF